mmetsp:Transcript_9004/g.16264  ORF Transcript_9004/g.16264 Transcript_9004/m.16264 type:complete len:312 (+) Transcript_9004:71-1006(+)
MEQPMVHDLAQDDSDEEGLAGKGAWDDFFDAPKLVGSRFDEVAEEELRATSRLAPRRQKSFRRAPFLSQEQQELSRFLARLLRYRATEMGLAVNADGFVPVAALVDLPELRSFSAEDILLVAQVSEGSKGRRFEISADTDQGPAVKATYVHPNSPAVPPQVLSQALRSLLRKHMGPAGMSQQLSADVSPYGGNQRQFRPSSRYPHSSLRRPGSYAAESNSVGTAVDNASSEDASLRSTIPSETWDEQRVCEWQLFHEPDTERVWFWNEATEEVFFADDEQSGWTQYLDSSARAWWWHEESARFFYHDEAAR